MTREHRMKQHRALVASASGFAAIVAGCSAIPADSADLVVALTGVVTARRDTDGVNGSAGNYRPGQGGAIGGLVAGAIVGMRTTGPFHVYTIRRNDGSERDVAAYYQVAEGTCVDVAVQADRGYFDSHWKPGEVVLRASTACASSAIEGKPRIP